MSESEDHETCRQCSRDTCMGCVKSCPMCLQSGPKGRGCGKCVTKSCPNCLNKCPMCLRAAHSVTAEGFGLPQTNNQWFMLLLFVIAVVFALNYYNKNKQF